VYQGHPFRTGVRSIVESNPATSLRRPVIGLEIGIDRANLRAKPKLPQLESLLTSIADPAAVRLLQIAPESLLDRVPSAVARFTELEYAHVSGRKLASYDALFELRKIKSLFVMSYRAPTLWPMAELESFRSIGDSLESCALSAAKLWLQRSKLCRFEGGAVKTLKLENCGSLDLDSLATLDGLEALDIMNQPHLKSLDFLGRCPSLRSLSLYSRLTDTNVDELKRTRTLTRVIIQLTAKRLEEVGVANPRLAITNGQVCFMAGKPAKHFGGFYPD
jgi:hypothetical protein